MMLIFRRILRFPKSMFVIPTCILYIYKCTVKIGYDEI